MVTHGGGARRTSGAGMVRKAGSALLDGTSIAAYDGRGHSVDAIFAGGPSATESTDSDLNWLDTNVWVTKLHEVVTRRLSTAQAARWARNSPRNWDYAYPHESMEREAIRRAWDSA